MKGPDMAEVERAAGPGFSAEDHRQLLVYHIGKLREQMAEVELAREPLKAAQEEFTSRVNAAKADLGKGYTRKYLSVLLEDSTARLRDLAAEENRRARDRAALGLPTFGMQADLFGDGAASMPAEARDEMQYEAEGYMRGRNGALEMVPEGTPPRFHQAVMRGYSRGQADTQSDYLAAQALIETRTNPDPNLEPVDLNADDEDEDEVLDQKVRKLRGAGFMRREPVLDGAAA